MSSILYNRYYPCVVDSWAEASDRIASAFSKGSNQYEFLWARFRAAMQSGQSWPYFQDDGALVEVRPSLQFLIREQKRPSLSPDK